MKCLRCGCDYGPRLPACDECGAHLGAELCPAGTLDALRLAHDMLLVARFDAAPQTPVSFGVLRDRLRAILDKAGE